MPLRHEEYINHLTPDVTNRTAREWAELAPEMRAGKFFLACVEDERLLNAMQQLVDDCMNEGVSEDEFIHRAFLMLGEITDPNTGQPYYDPAGRMESMTYEERIAYDNSVSNIDSRARLKLIYRTQSEIAAGYVQWQKALDPDNLRRFPAWRFVRQPGAKIKREDHVLHENEVRLITDFDYWLARNSPDFGGFNNPYPPFGYNSWMRVHRVPRDEAERLGLIAKDEEPTPPPDADRWSLQKAIEQANTASLDTLPPESVDRIRERCHAAGLTLTPAEGGGYTAKPASAGAGFSFSDELEEELDLLLQLLMEQDAPPVPPAPSPSWLSSFFGKLLPLIDPGDTYAANPYGCNRYGHKEGCPLKGTTREQRTRKKKKLHYVVDQTQTQHKQITDLAAAIERAARDGVRLEAVIYRPEFGELTLDCGNPGKSTDPIGQGGHGVQHAMEERHHISARDMAATLLLGKVKKNDRKESRLTVKYNRYEIILEREIKKGSTRNSNTRAKVQTAMKKE